MRVLSLVALLFGLAACGEVVAPTPKTGVDFWIDPAVCYNVGTQNLGLVLFVDSAQVGKAVLSVGEHSRVFGVSPGRHAVGAQEDRPNGYVWTATVTIPLDSVVSVAVGC